MRPPELSGDELVDALAAPVEPVFADGVVIVPAPPAQAHGPRWDRALERLATLPCIVVAGPAWAGTARPVDATPTGGDPSAAPPTADPLEIVDLQTSADALELVDLVADGPDDVAAVVATAEGCPIAAATLAVHLRASDRRPFGDALVAESALFSALQAGPEHRAWRQATPIRDRADGGTRVRVARAGDELRVTLARPAARNALDAAMRDELLAALAVAEADPSLRVVLGGEGPVFCAGGDLDEFGTAPDPATAHLVRLRTSIAAVLARLADRTVVHVQGACAGSGVELAAVAGRVVAAPDVTFRLPEVAMGLVPGAGGTASLPRRVGRHRTAWLALTGRAIDATRAQAWGLVDEIAVS